MQDLWSQLPWYAQLALKLLHEQALGPKSQYADYLAALPRRVDLPVLWSGEELQQLQYGPLVAQVRTPTAQLQAGVARASVGALGRVSALRTGIRAGGWAGRWVGGWVGVYKGQKTCAPKLQHR